MNNAQIGQAYEDLACTILTKHGYWAYNMKRNVHGQPVDIIAAKKKDNSNIIYLLDVKHVRESIPSFTLSRIEDNQWMSLQYMREFAHLDNLGFAIYFERTQDWYWLSYDYAYKLYAQNIKSIRLTLLEKFEDILE